MSQTANTVYDFQAIISSLVPNENGCLIWPRSPNVSGYGGYKISHKRSLPHRLVWSLANGDIPVGFCVMHTCDVPLCVNLGHLQLGTWGDNNRDRMRKGRSAVGERSGRVKLSDAKVREIRRRYATGTATCDKLGIEFGVSNHQISQVVTLKSWSHVI